MFCYQCEQTKNGTGCTAYGVCGKDPASAALQDLIIYAAKGVSMWAHRARTLGAKDADVDRYVIEALFTTITNVDFDPERLETILRRGITLRDRARSLYEDAAKAQGETPETLDGPATWVPEADLEGLLRQQESLGVESRRNELGADVVAVSYTHLRAHET